MLTSALILERFQVSGVSCQRRRIDNGLSLLKESLHFYIINELKSKMTKMS
jgi:hypothetical protein